MLKESGPRRCAFRFAFLAYAFRKFSVVNVTGCVLTEDA